MKSNVFFVVEHVSGHVLEITYVMAAAARQLSLVTGGDSVAVLLGHENLELANDLVADRVLYVDHPALTEFTPDAYLDILAPIVKDELPRVLLFGHTSIGMDIANGLSARLALPMVSQCKSFGEKDGTLKFISQI